MIRSEKLIDFGDSWFSAKTIKVVCNYNLLNKVKLLINVGEIHNFFEISKTHNLF